MARRKEPGQGLLVVEAAEVESLEQRVQRLGNELLKRILSFVGTADVAVVDGPSLEQAVAVRAAIGALDTEAVNYFAPEKARYFALHKAACAREKEVRAPLLALDAKVADAMRVFHAEATRQREAEERRLAEQARQEAEARATAEAAAFEQAGDTQMATAVLEEALQASPPVVALPNVTAGIATFVRRYLWRYRGGPNELAETPPAIVTRTLALIPREFCTVDERKLGIYARAMKGAGKVPGIEFYHVDDPRR